ncbi:hypothetical protein [Mesorhizobium sp. L-2-11]|uniref:hypothetical protein n=1 Tax=Mesorhizobium sp. L-2-11 TaxID=2744521 RepID=UPI0019383DD6|nr:hypothetical protein [Mesorhizobium sp. L-2-11]BCH19952.1 hypothetical protein MesoLjLa_68030 [Mesorhizobium sp. L-2-11]
MPTSHDLKGLMKFLAREEWRECFDEVFYDHFGPVLDAGDMDFEDIAEILGEGWAMTLWGCAFEDFLTRDFEFEGGNIVDEYLKRRGWKENAQAKTYMKALRTSVMSLYEVGEIVPGKSLVARDLVRGGDPIAVSEGTATRTLKQWDRIAARILPLLGKNVFAGGLLPFTPQATDALFDGLRQMFGKKNAKKLPDIKDEELQAAASMFTLSWLFDTLERAMGLPSMQNADGDELVFHDVRFSLASGVTRKDIAARVSNIAGMSRENANFWNWLEQKPKHGVQKRSASSFDITTDNGARVLGNVELKGKFLHLATNSAERAQDGTTLIQQALGDLVRTPLTEIRTVEQMMAQRPAREREDSASEIPAEIAEQVVHQFMDRQYRETLDQPVGMLGNKTPRQAAKSAAGRKMVAEWLKYLENQSSRRPDPVDPTATYSFEWMWRELNVLDLRH